MVTKKISIVRHGQTDFNARGVVQGRGIDAPLNETGLLQAQRFYERYQSVPFDKIYVSALQRTYQTVEQFINKGIPYESLSGLDEIDWGIWEGKGLSTEGRIYYQSTTRRWAQGETHLPIEGGESPEMVQGRQREAMEHIMSKKEESHILVCMHGRAMRILLPTLLNIPLKDMDEFPHENTSLYELMYDGSSYKLITQNEISHLDVSA